jgi:hypothetical protein
MTSLINRNSLGGFSTRVCLIQFGYSSSLNFVYLPRTSK